MLWTDPSTGMGSSALRGLGNGSPGAPRIIFFWDSGTTPAGVSSSNYSFVMDPRASQELNIRAIERRRDRALTVVLWGVFAALLLLISR